MAKIWFLCTTLVNGVARKSYELLSGERVELLLFSKYGEPIVSSLYYKDGIPYAENCLLIKGENDYYLKNKKRPDNVWQQSFFRGADEVVATVYSELFSVLCVDYQGKFINHTLGDVYDAVTFTCDNFCNNILVFAKKEDKTRILIVNLLSLNLVLDVICNEYELEERLSILISYNDIVKRKKRIVIAFNENGITTVEKVFECASVHVSTPAQIKLSFLQGMLAEDYEYAKNLLSDDFKEDFEEIRAFLGNGDELIVLGDNEFMYGDKIVAFECEDGKIIDISLSE